MYCPVLIIILSESQQDKFYDDLSKGWKRVSVEETTWATLNLETVCHEDV